jgi:hypothetical protein
MPTHPPGEPTLPIADRKHRAATLLAEHPEWSTRRIAAASGLAPGTVGKLRGAAVPTEVRVGRNGRRRAVDTGHGRRIACDLLVAEPGISLREVARRAGISPGTVRDVRNRMREADERVTVRSVAVRRVERGRASPQGFGNLIVAKLCMDPALRYTLTGRRLLTGLLAAGAMDNGDLTDLAGSLPAHCVALVAAAAADCARMWQEFAEAVHSQHAFQDAPSARPERVGHMR